MSFAKWLKGQRYRSDMVGWFAGFWGELKEHPRHGIKDAKFLYEWLKYKGHKDAIPHAIKAYKEWRIHKGELPDGA